MAEFGTIIDRAGLVSGEEDIAAAIGGNSIQAMIARAACSRYSQELAAFLSDEFSRPKANHAEVLMGLAILQAQTLASAAAQVVKPSGDGAVVDMARHVTAERLPVYITQIRRIIEEAGR